MDCYRRPRSPLGGSRAVRHADRQTESISVVFLTLPSPTGFIQDLVVPDRSGLPSTEDDCELRIAVPQWPPSRVSFAYTQCVSVVLTISVAYFARPG